MAQNPRVMALRFRIWQVAQAEEWNITLAEIAERLGDVNVRQVSQAAQAAGWLSRLRCTSRVNPAEYMGHYPAAVRGLEAAIAHELAGTSLRDGGRFAA